MEVRLTYANGTRRVLTVLTVQQALRYAEKHGVAVKVVEYRTPKGWENVTGVYMKGTSYGAKEFLRDQVATVKKRKRMTMDERRERRAWFKRNPKMTDGVRKFLKEQRALKARGVSKGAKRALKATREDFEIRAQSYARDLARKLVRSDRKRSDKYRKVAGELSGFRIRSKRTKDFLDWFRSKPHLWR